MSKAWIMQEALRCARQALPDCLPNPPVGSILVKQDRIVTQGYTRAPGHSHAEADVLSQVEGTLEEYELYVILEPCSFHGRTPSCAQAIVERRVGKVYVGILDPHPRNRGAGIALLEQAGIPVALGLLAEPIAAWLSPYLYHEPEPFSRNRAG
ncbi:bifunctional diaminohydroxyphosphoribosylaminopyrimidine deaminase/5-amino-6-(5-phosphoribosylamino)uracil reductase RibD [Serratia ureilytica]|uniref:bifunctional diaminohydroxyphosphoribosylaminopyrimidine deaminase/5-amino-6-(5-phosphoribosylamino)uracil reductase RibD n=1 Tax=Serratia ureilytica TaxID=300181 RepID=UPI00214F3D5F|nr:bifunctional diaminohydroxyphosphoribosylaminopyrimidine deaminase/5-amino-6-(5-phosphoribosylamino)uracil reductase RibD [Serratia ureilytica]UUW18431.1 bifunctional diaminohydroxyphosphoribosylaminopyrimidine deaminase/5-amino-6-(5-phosphoribosylamino)uracil reductase RibD [Serratia ureilytica]